MLKQVLIVVPHGFIESGNISFQVDEVTGIIDFQESIVAGIGPFTRTDSHSGEARIDPKLLLSSNVVPGMKIPAGTAVIVVKTVQGKEAVVYISINQANVVVSGSGLVDLSATFIFIKSVLLNGVVNGFNVILDLRSAGELMSKKNKMKIISDNQFYTLAQKAHVCAGLAWIFGSLVLFGPRYVWYFLAAGVVIAAWKEFIYDQENESEEIRGSNAEDFIFYCVGFFVAVGLYIAKMYIAPMIWH